MSKKSSVIIGTTYDKKRLDLTLTFSNGKKYIYTPVSPVFNEYFNVCRSKGKFFNSYIKDNPAFTVAKIVS